MFSRVLFEFPANLSVSSRRRHSDVIGLSESEGPAECPGFLTARMSASGRKPRLRLVPTSESKVAVDTGSS